MSSSLMLQDRVTWTLKNGVVGHGRIVLLLPIFSGVQTHALVAVDPLPPGVGTQFSQEAHPVIHCALTWLTKEKTDA